MSQSNLDFSRAAEGGNRSGDHATGGINSLAYSAIEFQGDNFAGSGLRPIL